MSKRWILVATAGAAGLAAMVMATAVGVIRSGGDAGKVSVVAASQDDAGLGVTTTLPELPAGLPRPPEFLNTERVKAHCPRPPDPGGPSNVMSINLDWAPGYGEVTPQAAMAIFVRGRWPGADLESFPPTAVSSERVYFENDHAALAVTRGEGGWRVTTIVECAPMTAQWSAERPI